MKRRFRSLLGTSIKRHLALRRSLGFILKNAEYALDEFDRYLADHYPRTKTITREIVVNYLETTRHLRATSRADRISNLRQFCRFLFLFDGNTYIPERALIPPARVEVKPHIYCEEEVMALIREARTLRPVRSLVPHTYATILGLLWVSGLRIGEVVNLNLEDVDLVSGVLQIRQSKFHKSRLVPLSASATQALDRYCHLRLAFGDDEDAQAPFFLNARRRRCTTNTLSGTIRRLARRLGLKTLQGRTPRVHDFRHAFATRWLDDFYRMGKDPSACLPVLATYLGHVNIASTQVYLHPSLDLLTSAAERFARHVEAPVRSRRTS